MLRQIDVEEAKARFARLVSAAAKGEEIVLTKGGRPMAKLVAFTEDSEKEKAPSRPMG
jgi:prevent-host-death family protein